MDVIYPFHLDVIHPFSTPYPFIHSCIIFLITTRLCLVFTANHRMQFLTYSTKNTHKKEKELYGSSYPHTKNVIKTWCSTDSTINTGNHPDMAPHTPVCHTIHSHTITSACIQNSPAFIQKSSAALTAWRNAARNLSPSR